jgi:hypothetical protein
MHDSNYFLALVSLVLIKLMSSVLFSAKYIPIPFTDSSSWSDCFSTSFDIFPISKLLTIIEELSI